VSTQITHGQWLAGAAVAAALLAGCSTAVVPPGVGGTLAGDTARQVVSAAMLAARRAGSVHYVLDSRRAQRTESITGDASATEGIQDVTSGSHRVEAMLVGRTAFVRGDAVGLENVLGLTSAVAAKYEGEWISLVSDDPPYASVVNAVLLGHVLEQVIPTGPLSLAPPAPPPGGSRTTVLGVRGGLPAPVRGVVGTSTLYVSSASPTVPVRFTGSSGKGSTAVHDDASFSAWGRPLALSPPTGAVSYELLPSA
jgi:hypothetical protein